MSDPEGGGKTVPFESAKMVAAITLLGRTGAQQFRFGYSDPDDGEPTAWYACATWAAGAEAAGGLTPETAILRLCEAVIDGGRCTHCGQRTIFDPSDPTTDYTTELLDSMGCRYAWDPELATFRRSCEGNTPAPRPDIRATRPPGGNPERNELLLGRPETEHPT